MTKLTIKVTRQHTTVLGDMEHQADVKAGKHCFVGFVLP